MSRVNAEVQFYKGFRGELITSTNRVAVGKEGLMPYDLLQGALASCLHATFLEIAYKKRLELSSVKYIINGNKRETSPNTLESVHLNVYFEGAVMKDPVIKSFQLATKYCSVYQTISQVAEMSYELYFDQEAV